MVHPQLRSSYPLGTNHSRSLSSASSLFACNPFTSRALSLTLTRPHSAVASVRRAEFITRKQNNKLTKPRKISSRNQLFFDRNHHGAFRRSSPSSGGETWSHRRGATKDRRRSLQAKAAGPAKGATTASRCPFARAWRVAVSSLWKQQLCQSSFLSFENLSTTTTRRCRTTSSSVTQVTQEKTAYWGVGVGVVFLEHSYGRRESISGQSTASHTISRITRTRHDTRGTRTRQNFDCP